jgi:Ca-activated chloride channel homolog
MLLPSLMLRAPTAWRRLAPTLVLALLMALTAAAALEPAPARETSELAVRITSPLGRTGFVGRIRIVAQIQKSPDVSLQPVRFFVDDVLLGEVPSGPPYAVEWVDENPFEPREISVEVTDARGEAARDRVLLEPLEITELAEVSSVVLDVAVHDAEGRFVRDLGKEDFHLLEDGVPQTLDVVQPQALPATYTLLVDSSQSMARRTDLVRDAAATLVARLRPEDRVVIAPFTRTVGPITGPTTDHQTIQEAIDAITSRGGTAILDAVRTMAGQLAAHEGRHVLVLLTDGYDEHSSVEWEEALQAVKDLQATLYVVGIAGSAGISLKGERFLRALVAESGGRVFFPTRDREIPGVKRQLAEEVQLRYVVGYTPTNQRVDGTWRNLRLVAADPEWKVRTRPGYFAPTPPPIRPSLEFTMMNHQRELLEVSLPDLLVREDGIEQVPDTFHEAVSPVSMVLALDASGSMKKDAAAVQEAARAFVEAIRPEDELSLYTFADTVTIAHDLARIRRWTHTAIDEYVASGGTALYDALHDAFARLQRREGRKAVVVVTDGRDENNPGTAPGSVRTFDEVLKLMKQADVTVFAIGLGPKVDRPVLERLAADSGGEAYFPEVVADLEDQYRRIVENLRRRYVIGYTSTNAARDGAWRQVEIVSQIPGTKVLSKGGYFAPPE